MFIDSLVSVALSLLLRQVDNVQYSFVRTRRESAPTIGTSSAAG